MDATLRDTICRVPTVVPGVCVWESKCIVDTWQRPADITFVTLPVYTLLGLSGKEQKSGWVNVQDILRVTGDTGAKAMFKRFLPLSWRADINSIIIASTKWNQVMSLKLSRDETCFTLCMQGTEVGEFKFAGFPLYLPLGYAKDIAHAAACGAYCLRSETHGLATVARCYDSEGSLLQVRWNYY